MASFTAAVTNLEAIGPVIDLQVAVSLAAESAMKNAGTPVPAPIPVSMMVDTGASTTVIQTGLAQQLGLQPVGTLSVNTPSSANVQCNTYAVRLLLPENLVAGVVAIEAPLVGQNIQGLIGRDLLQHGVLIYLGKENQFTLSF